MIQTKPNLNPLVIAGALVGACLDPQMLRAQEAPAGKLPLVVYEDKGGVSNHYIPSGWTEYSIDLADKDLSRVKTGFCWSLAGQSSPIVFHLDDIRFE